MPPNGRPWWQRPSLGQLAGPQPGPRSAETPLGHAAPFAPFSPAGPWLPDEAELRTWGGAELLKLEPSTDKTHPGLRLVQARFPLPMPVLISVGATDPGLAGGTPWTTCPLVFWVTIGVAAGQHAFPFITQAPPVNGVFQFSQSVAARMITVDVFFIDPTATPVAANVWAGVAPFFGPQ